MEVKSNYDIQADKCKLEFIKMDHKKIAAKFNLNYDENYKGEEIIKEIEKILK